MRLFTKEEKAILNCCLDTDMAIDEKMCEGCMFNKNDDCTVDKSWWEYTNLLKYKDSIKQKLINAKLL